MATGSAARLSWCVAIFLNDVNTQSRGPRFAVTDAASDNLTYLGSLKLEICTVDSWHEYGHIMTATNVVLGKRTSQGDRGFSKGIRVLLDDQTVSTNCYAPWPNSGRGRNRHRCRLPLAGRPGTAACSGSMGAAPEHVGLLSENGACSPFY